MRTYLIGPSGSGKTTQAKRFNREDMDQIIKRRYPEIWATKPWRYWINKEGNRQAALEWEDLQSRLIEETAAPQNALVIAHPRAFTRARLLPSGITILLDPHPEAIAEREHDKNGSEITKLSQQGWPNIIQEVVAVALELGPVVRATADWTEDRVANVIEKALKAKDQHGFIWDLVQE